MDKTCTAAAYGAAFDNGHHTDMHRILAEPALKPGGTIKTALVIGATQKCETFGIEATKKVFGGNGG